MQPDPEIPDLAQQVRDLAEQVDYQRQRAERAERLAAERLQTIREADNETMRLHDERNAATHELAQAHRRLALAHETIATLVSAYLTGTTLMQAAMAERRVPA